MIGQKYLIEKLNNYNIDTFPHSSILVGKKGMGKHTIINYIKDNILKIPVVDITNTISADYIDAIYRNPNINIYIVDLSQLTEKEQNILLKFIEEPLVNSFVILLCENTNFVLNTVLNRCVIFELGEYSREELSSFFTNEPEEDRKLILQLVNSPGSIINNNLANLRAMCELCDKIVNKISLAGFSNTLSIAEKINFKDEYNKFDFELFMDCLSYMLFEAYKETKAYINFEMYLLTVNERKKLVDKRLNKEIFFKNYITKLWRLNHKNKKEF